jgi:hypothetical protein
MKIEAKQRLGSTTVTAAPKWTVTFSFKDRDKVKIDYPITVPAGDKDEAKAKAIKRFVKDHGSSVRYTVPSVKLAAALTEKQKQLDVNGDGKISGDDLKKLREGEKPQEVDASAPSWVSAGIQDRLKESGVKVTQAIKMGPAVTFAYSWDDLDVDDKTTSECISMFIEGGAVTHVAHVERMSINSLHFDVDSCSVMISLSAATVTVVQS